MSDAQRISITDSEVNALSARTGQRIRCVNSAPGGATQGGHTYEIATTGPEGLPRTRPIEID
jgi:hypothetical protein